MKVILTKVLYILIAIAALLGLFNSAIALLLGFTLSLILESPFKKYNQKTISYLLKIAVVGLGFGMLVTETIATSKDSLGLTFLSIVLTLVLGILLSKLLKLNLKLGYLITSGTSICGGSAIAAIAPAINAKSKTMSVALGIVFLLNAVALFIFPAIGHFIGLSQEQFGLWCAIAIHDTSSVVGAALDYGDEALKIATTVKLSRTLWIIPLSIFSIFMFKSKGNKIKIPYFILLFIGAIIINSCHFIPIEVSSTIVLISKRLLVLTLFLVGTTISLKDLKSVGFKPIGFAFILWVFISVFSLIYILN